jgi:hypothetical protein
MIIRLFYIVSSRFFANFAVKKTFDTLSYKNNYGNFTDVAPA